MHDINEVAYLITYLGDGPTDDQGALQNVSWSEEPTKKTEETGDQVCMYQEEQRHTPLGTTLTSGKLQRMPHATMNRSATTWPALANSRFL